MKSMPVCHLKAFFFFANYKIATVKFESTPFQFKQGQFCCVKLGYLA